MWDECWLSVLALLPVTPLRLGFPLLGLTSCSFVSYTGRPDSIHFSSVFSLFVL